MRIDGGCHCGALRYEAEIDPGRVSICHCTDCQRLTGSAYRVTVLARRDDIRLVRGEPAVYAKRGDNERTRFQHFCGACGSPLFTSGEGEDAEEWGIRWGSIDQRSALSPRRRVWCRSAAAWSDDIRALPRTETE